MVDYFGKVCSKHPELEGLREGSSRLCKQCRKDTVARFRANHPNARAEADRRWALKHPEKRRAREKKYREAHPQDIVDRKKRYRLNNLEKVKVKVREWARLNADKRQALEAKRKASKLQATPAWANDFFIKEAYHLAKVRERVLGGKWHVDHIVPLRSKIVCGLHVENNLQVIPAVINMRKGNRMDERTSNA